MTVVQKPGKNFGTSEISVDVKAIDLEPGVYVDGFLWNQSGTCVVQEVKETDDRVMVLVANFSNGEQPRRFFYKDRPVTAWGRL
ncbi:hypothetical protein KITKAT_51 [Arthrobacter phage Kitkat]|uniref:Uncharacterized protein n=2 Tax=Kelleziovirus TaxID=1982236 RepID=A0A140G6D4_9CAUD|nr:hypothetical protein BJD78_gp49 [Arthrobacter phage KellEzio]YP_009303334.1 hypothetical protein BJD77_gp051 [Arthrobacter phage Kitkat]AMM44219.1 hypothetical protein KELLEZIO_49 [Arthrobacter phage KellEzio]AMM44312.1 hypothetical protein KITKAT_51 [Arthrobacter phage Kitkat]